MRAKADELGVSGLMSFRGYHGVGKDEASYEYVWGHGSISTDDVLAMDDARNVKVLMALAHPVRLRMMNAVIQEPGTAAELCERPGVTSTGQTYHTLNLLQNGGMIQQDEDGRYAPVGDTAARFLVTLGGLFMLTESEYAPTFLDIDLDGDEEEGHPEEAVSGE